MRKIRMGVAAFAFVAGALSATAPASASPCDSLQAALQEIEAQLDQASAELTVMAAQRVEGGRADQQAYNTQNRTVQRLIALKGSKQRAYSKCLAQQAAKADRKIASDHQNHQQNEAYDATVGAALGAAGFGMLTGSMRRTPPYGSYLNWPSNRTPYGSGFGSRGSGYGSSGGGSYRRY